MEQAHLTEREIKRLQIGNQHTKQLSVIEWQVVKGAATHYAVMDWTAKVDPTLTMHENVRKMAEYGTRNNESTMRELSHKIR